MVTSTTPMRAVANWRTTHSGQFVDQTPKKSSRPAEIPGQEAPGDAINLAVELRPAQPHSRLAGDQGILRGKPAGRLPQPAAPIVRPSTQGVAAAAGGT